MYVWLMLRAYKRTAKSFPLLYAIIMLSAKVGKSALESLNAFFFYWH